jgi:hypothetical protein
VFPVWSGASPAKALHEDDDTDSNEGIGFSACSYSMRIMSELCGSTAQSPNKFPFGRD